MANDIAIFDPIINGIITSFWAIIFWVILSVFFFIWIQRKTNGRVELWFEKTSNNKLVGTTIAALMGAIPGCGAAIVMSTLYKSKKISLGMLTSTFIATSGDAAFLLLSKEPTLWAKITAVSIVVGVITGIIVDFVVSHEDAKETHKIQKEKKKEEHILKAKTEIREHNHSLEDNFFVLAIIFAILTIVIMSFPAIDYLLGGHLFGEHKWFESNGMNWINNLYYVITFLAAILSLFMYLLMRFDNGDAHDHELDLEETHKEAFINNTKHVVHITVWITFAVIITELIFWGIGEEPIKNFLNGSGLLVVFATIAVGILPGCGPQILITELYLSVGIVSPAGLYANYIVQDGDAAFPLLVSDKKTALILKFINIIPAVIVGLSIYFININFF